jgi:hypothetical protein
MRFAKTLTAVLLFVCAGEAAATDDSFQGSLQRSVAVHPSQYSFADLYRVTVAGPAANLFPVLPLQEGPVRVAAGQVPVQFSVSEQREPRLGLLLLSGIAAAMWVARRRLGYGM